MDLHKTAEAWAEKTAASEAEAFETALKRIKPFEVSDEVEQAYRQGYSAGYKAAEDRLIHNMAIPTKAAATVMNENAELREELKVQAEQIQRLRECIARSNEEFYE